MKKKPYESPTVVHTEKIEARAVVCDRSDQTCSGGVIQS